MESESPSIRVKHRLRAHARRRLLHASLSRTRGRKMTREWRRSMRAPALVAGVVGFFLACSASDEGSTKGPHGGAGGAGGSGAGGNAGESGSSGAGAGGASGSGGAGATGAGGSGGGTSGSGGTSGRGGMAGSGGSSGSS